MGYRSLHVSVCVLVCQDAQIFLRVTPRLFKNKLTMADSATKINKKKESSGLLFLQATENS